MAREYSEYFEVGDDFVTKVQHYSNKNKKIKNFKKRLKSKR